MRNRLRLVQSKSLYVVMEPNRGIEKNTCRKKGCGLLLSMKYCYHYFRNIERKVCLLCVISAIWVITTAFSDWPVITTAFSDWPVIITAFSDWPVLKGKCIQRPPCLPCVAALMHGVADIAVPSLSNDNFFWLARNDNLFRLACFKRYIMRTRTVMPHHA